MIKIASPVQYESSLDELNRVRPLNLSVQSKLSLDYPVLCKNPVGVGQPAISRLLGCNEQGALLRNKGNSFHNYQLVLATLTYELDWCEIDFSQKVFAVILSFTATGTWRNLFLTASIYSVRLRTFTQVGTYFIYFTGLKMHFQQLALASTKKYLSVYGFY